VNTKRIQHKKNKTINAVEIGPLSHGEGASWIRLHANTRYTYLGAISDPCCIREPIVNHSELFKENLFSKTSGASELQGCGFSHSYGLNLNTKRANTLQELYLI